MEEFLNNIDVQGCVQGGAINAFGGILQGLTLSKNGIDWPTVFVVTYSLSKKTQNLQN